jgi:hypothetical protein
MIMTGSHAAHAAVALWEDSQLYIVESQDAWYFGSESSGVQKSKYEDWMVWA